MTTIGRKTCPECQQSRPADAFRQNVSECVYCQWKPMRKRAKARYKDKFNADRRARQAWSPSPSDQAFSPRLAITEDDFVAWYQQQKDECHYCGTTMEEFRALELRRGGFGYFVSWDIDRIDSSKPYQVGNLALSCFLCNMAKGNLLSGEEAKVIGGAVRQVLRQRLKDKAQSAPAPAPPQDRSIS